MDEIEKLIDTVSALSVPLEAQGKMKGGWEGTTHVSVTCCCSAQRNRLFVVSRETGFHITYELCSACNYEVQKWRSDNVDLFEDEAVVEDEESEHVG